MVEKAIDRYDAAIIELLKADARISVSDIASKVNLSRSAVTARIKKLEQRKVIRGYYTDVDLGLQEQTIKAILEITFDTSAATGNCSVAAEKIVTFPGVVSCYGVSGDTDLFVHVEVRNMEQLADLNSLIHALPNLRNLITHTVIKTFFETPSR